MTKNEAKSVDFRVLPVELTTMVAENMQISQLFRYEFRSLRLP
jgi:hypothetical protein